MDLNLEFASHQKALMSADRSGNKADRKMHLEKASEIAGRISSFQHRMGAAAACAWSASRHATIAGA